MPKDNETRELPDDALILRLESDKEELFNLRFQLATGQLDNPSRIRQVRHQIARTLTVLREREIERHEELVASQAEAEPAAAASEPAPEAATEDESEEITEGADA